MEATVAKYNAFNRNLYICAGLLVVDGAYFVCTNPRTQQSAVLAFGTLLLITTIYMVCLAGVGAAALYVAVSPSAQRLIALTVAGAASFLLVMQSIGQLNIRDVLAVAPIALIAYFYIAYGRYSRKTG